MASRIAMIAYLGSDPNTIGTGPIIITPPPLTSISVFPFLTWCREPISIKNIPMKINSIPSMIHWFNSQPPHYEIKQEHDDCPQDHCYYGHLW